MSEKLFITRSAFGILFVDRQDGIFAMVNSSTNTVNVEVRELDAHAGVSLRPKYLKKILDPCSRVRTNHLLFDTTFMHPTNSPRLYAVSPLDNFGGQKYDVRKLAGIMVWLQDGYDKIFPKLRKHDLKLELADREGQLKRRIFEPKKLHYEMTYPRLKPWVSGNARSQHGDHFTNTGRNCYLLFTIAA